MLLYKTQPKNSNENTLVNLSTKEKVVDDIRDSIPKYNGRNTKGADIITMITDASLVDGMIATSDYKNILVVPSFENSDYPRLRDNRYRSVRSAGDHLLPIIHALNETHGNLYVAQPKVGNVFSDLYNRYDVNIINTDSWFRVDGSFSIKTDIKFDAVVLLGNEGYKKGSFNAGQVKKKFARYCTENFELIDVYRGTLRKLTGATVSKELSIRKLVGAINTPSRIIIQGSRLSTEMLTQLRNHKDRLLYVSLAQNIETIKQWYKVF